MLYAIARWIWKLARWIWSALIATFLVSYAANVATMPEGQVSTTSLIRFVGKLFQPGFNQTLALSMLIPLVIITLLAGIVTRIDEYRSGGTALKQYLRDVADNNQDLKPVGFAQQSALISVSVPL